MVRDGITSIRYGPYLTKVEGREHVIRTECPHFSSPEFQHNTPQGTSTKYALLNMNSFSPVPAILRTSFTRADKGSNYDWHQFQQLLGLPLTSLRISCPSYIRLPPTKFVIRTNDWRHHVQGIVYWKRHGCGFLCILDGKHSAETAAFWGLGDKHPRSHAAMV